MLQSLDSKSLIGYLMWLENKTNCRGQGEVGCQRASMLSCPALQLNTQHL